MTGIYDFDFELADGATQPLGDYRGKVLLIVNTASKCGFTPQFDGLEKLHEQLAERGLVIIGFPCNQFGHQDPGTIGEIVEFCQTGFGVKFPMANKIEVNGAGAHPLYAWLKEQAPGVLGTRNIKWNFTKFLVDRDGNVVERFAPATTPEKIAEAIERQL